MKNEKKQTISHFLFPRRIARYSGQVRVLPVASAAEVEFKRENRTAPLRFLLLAHRIESLKGCIKALSMA
jgi:hypothetical protein